MIFRLFLALCVGSAAFAEELPLAEPTFPPVNMDEVELGLSLIHI